MLIRHPAFEGVTVYIISREAVFARMLELELREAGMTAVRAEEFPKTDAENGEMRVFTASSEILEAEESRFAHVEFGFSDDGSGRSERYFKRPFSVDAFTEAVSSFVLSLGGDRAENGGYAPVSSVSQAETVHVPPSVSAGLTYDSEQRVFSYDGEPITLTETEFSLLSLLYERRGEAISREEILAAVWGREENENIRKTNLTDVYIRYLREKLDERFDARLILSVRGKGYMLR